MTARILLLAGTAEARALAQHLAGVAGVKVIASLAGVTSAPARIAAETRVGGFGGAAGLAAYMEAQQISAVVDATHPFAAQMATNAAIACAAAGIPRLRLTRPEWDPVGDWRSVADIAEAAAALPPGAHALLTTGRKETEAFAARTDLRCLLRSIEPAGPLPPHLVQLTARPPFSKADELGLMRDHAITHLVSKNAGGPGRAKLDAAAELGLPIVMIERPAMPPGPLAMSVTEAAAWVSNTCAPGA